MTNPVNSVVHSEAIELLSGLEANSVPMIFADPPYGIGYHSNYYKGKNPHAPITNDWNFHIGTFLQECSRVLIPGGVIYLCCRWDVMPLWIPYVQAGLKLKTIISWVKDNWSAGDLTGSFGNQYEQILFIAKGKNKIRGKRFPNVWNFPRVPAKGMLHPAQKPLELVERAIEASTDPGDLVVDVFSGSGTTGKAAQNTGRNFLLCDLDITMVELSCHRVGIPFTGKTLIASPPALDQELIKLVTLEEFGLHPEDVQYVLEYLAANRVQMVAERQLELPMST